ncbi:hypothetical protein cypCar_00010877 [Cyprinus carpio]|nr:hypothetical protein cypCar_00010877 [Cyprinus carpio]
MKTKITKKTILKFFGILLLILVLSVLILFAVVIGRTFTFKVNTELGQWENATTIYPSLSPEQKKQLLENLKVAVQIPTVSFSESKQNTTALQEFDLLLRRVFPKVFSSSLVQHEMVGNYSHLLTVPGSEADLEPYMLLAHIDVVPADEADGWLLLLCSRASMVHLLERTIDINSLGVTVISTASFSQSVSGSQGAVNIVKLLKSRGVKLLYVLDEGLTIMDGVVDGLIGPGALIGVSEKGQATVKLSVSTPPGHSSMPPRESSIGILASAVARQEKKHLLLEKNRMPNLFGHGPERATFEHLAHKFGWPYRMVMSNLWLFSSLLSGVLEGQPDTNAFVRTTTAVTMFNSGVKINVMPAYAEAFVNFRIHSSQTLQEVLKLIESTVSDERVKVEFVSGFDPLPISSYDEDTFGYQIIKKTVHDIFPEVTVSPGVCVGNTDSRHYTELSPDIYRFVPSWYKPGDSARFHGVNERISIQNYEEIVLFYFQLMQNSDIINLPGPRI